MKYHFADDFWWGSATSAPQSEGASARDGKSRNIFDYWHETAPERFHHQVGPSEASTFYDNFRDDILLLKTLGHNTFRTSISWSRLIPDGDGEVNPKAVAFYNALIDSLLAQGITPFINLYHFDMPLCMQQKGGWESRAVVEAYARYAKTCFTLFGDRVTHWFTFNEPIVPVEAGYLNDLHYPCVVDFKRAVVVAYHSVLAHAKAVSHFRALGNEGTIGIILNLSPTYPRSTRQEDLLAANYADLLLNKSFLDPVTKGRYPQELVDLLKANGLQPQTKPEDAQLIADGVVDILGVNYYQPRRVKAKEGFRTTDRVTMPEDLFSYYEMPGRKINPHRGWEIYEKGLYDILMDLKENYGNIPCYISENGMGVEGEEAFIGASGRVEDDYRIDFIRDHLKWLHQALAEGSQCKGYHLWTFIDCWSWLNAYKNRYGLVRLDRENQRRTLKKSGYWFAETARQNGFD
ncbi:glycoside hydrolase family 1 protein [Serratia plymuthica]|uniref:6-phospho-beta-glucosidase gmuD n=1 Tax=Serratia plymuthica TaxID=82996 RepID=A0A2X4UGE5_SERPL|nr:glycoside hydrolase family 1 protein [Serratia plymuthica]QPS22421.1 glycoside hydrolase family 1 protein [Serratia plymuthica]QPS64030.1 glycoside hydrolase family 1 protein [Serratia plymuthica]RKS63565.1 aryl-phospho-beta-glucosidase [Serratia plymuthica]CAI2399647.1 6-phospho-beta-glucosidase gmuD [Serratia plymuthica]SQI31990.1 6-phospho-beta-glucosidase gmuD [Serratia plymuthica]